MAKCNQLTPLPFKGLIKWKVNYNTVLVFTINGEFITDANNERQLYTKLGLYHHIQLSEETSF